MTLSSCFIFKNDSSKTEIPIQCHIRHGRFSLVERTMAWQSRGQPLFLVFVLTGCMALGKLLSPLCASVFPPTPCLSFSFRWLGPLGKECLLFVQFSVFCWRPWGLQCCNNRDSHHHLSLIYSPKEPDFHKGMDVPGPCVNSLQQGAIMTRIFSFWCVRTITSPGLRSGLMQVLFLLMLVSLIQECGVSCASVGGPRVSSVSMWSVSQLALLSARYAHDQALSHVASFGIIDSLCDLSVLLYCIYLSSVKAGWSHTLLCLHVEADQDTHSLTGCCKCKQHINALSSWFP